MKKIKLTNSEKCVLINKENYEWLSRWKWYLDKSGYAKRTSRVNIDGKKTDVLLHRLVLGAKKGEICDHINRKKLDNREVNLRICSSNINSHNRSPKPHSSKFKGVCWRDRPSPWQATISHKRKNIYLGCYLYERDAAIAYNEAARHYFGEYAYQNNIKVCVGSPHASGWTHIKFAQSLTKLALQNKELHFVDICRELPDIARNRIVYEAFKNNCSHILFVDDDSIFESDLLNRLLVHNKDFVSALVWNRRPPFFPSIYRYNPKKSNIGNYDPILSMAQFELISKKNKGKKWGDVFEVDAAHLAATLIKTEVFKKLKHPFFRFERKGGEDLSFSKRIKEKGFRIFCDTSLVVGHLISSELRFKNLKEHKEYGQQIQKS